MESHCKTYTKTLSGHNRYQTTTMTNKKKRDILSVNNHKSLFSYLKGSKQDKPGSRHKCLEVVRRRRGPLIRDPGVSDLRTEDQKTVTHRSRCLLSCPLKSSVS